MNIYERIGFKGLVKVAFESSNLLSFPYYLYVYHNILKKSRNLDDVLSFHENLYFSSFGNLRPKYGKVRKVLEEYEIE